MASPRCGQKRERKQTAAHIVAKYYLLYLAVRMHRYGSLIKSNPLLFFHFQNENLLWLNYRINVPVRIFMNSNSGFVLGTSAIAFLRAADVIEQIQNFFIVQLHELRGHLELRHRDPLLPGLILSGPDPLEQVAHRPRDDTLLHWGLSQFKPGPHGVRLAAARLSVSQHGRIVPVMYMKHNKYKIGVINDPLGQPTAGSACRLILKFWDGRTDGQSVKIVITSGRDCGRPRGSKYKIKVINDPLNQSHNQDGREYFFILKRKRTDI